MEIFPSGILLVGLILFRNKADAFFCECSSSRKNGTFKIWSAYTAETASEVPKVQTDNRPHEQRVNKPRKARRLNHSFMHLYRHDSRLFDDTKIASGSRTLSFPRVYLKEYGGYTDGDIDDMSLNFPPLLDLDVRRHVQPKMRFLKYTLGGVNNDSNETNSGPIPLSDVGKSVPPQFFGSRLEKVIAPRHAFLMHLGLPHGPVLLENNAQLFQEFLLACRKSKLFAALCNDWKQKFGTQYADPDYLHISNECNYNDNIVITSNEIDAFDSLFQRGILAAARDDMDPKNQHSKLVSISCAQMIYLLAKHGSNPLETDVRDISLLHWSAGSGQLDALKQLVRALPGGIQEAVKLRADRDGATILHWAAAGANPKNFGCGGHFHVCKYLMEHCGSDIEKEIVSSQTKDGNSVLMWAAWSGSYDIVKLMVRHRADIEVSNRNGCTVAHWAASGGSLEVCRYLNDIGVDFRQPNFAGNTPLSHSVAYGRVDVIRWLKDELKVEDSGSHAMDLALDFFNWDSIEEEDDRKNIVDILKSTEQIDL